MKGYSSQAAWKSARSPSRPSSVVPVPEYESTAFSANRDAHSSHSPLSMCQPYGCGVLGLILAPPVTALPLGVIRPQGRLDR